MVNGEPSVHFRKKRENFEVFFVKMVDEVNITPHYDVIL